ncbi:MAG: mersacidin/lichenicidin family type 2 lantibiotic [Ktedonobacteraceae bacterium]|nr:mersacidin/lichenicidin family type 2 lantibiotic [Ktedonobacteraceae bacterium]MBO0789447.1 mersacidin/lichenicidin family type 2 lantibiotic [Ktedonobacteraceae bacterium]
MKLDIIRAWKDELYRSNLTAEELAQLPENPAGSFELSEEELEAAHGARGGSHGRGDNQFVTAFLICLNTIILAVCVNSNGSDC